jgi:hypothetical protein
VLAAVTRELAPRGGVVILVDDANAMPDACASALAALYRGARRRAAHRARGGAGPAAQRVFRAFGSSIDVVLLAGGMSGREARRYVETRLAYGGARPELVAQFDDATIDALHRASQGVPRRLNQAAEDVVRRATRGSLPRLRELTQATHVAPAATAVPRRRRFRGAGRGRDVAGARGPARSSALRRPAYPFAAAAGCCRGAHGPSEESEEDGAGILLPEIFDRVPGEPAGEYRIVRGTPVRATPARSPEDCVLCLDAPRGLRRPACARSRDRARPARAADVWRRPPVRPSRCACRSVSWPTSSASCIGVAYGR